MRLGNTTDSPDVGDLVLSTLCPVLVKVVSDGMRQYATGVQVFGRVQLTVWKIVEASGELGMSPYLILFNRPHLSGLFTNQHT